MNEDGVATTRRPKAKRQNLTLRITSEMRTRLESAAGGDHSISEVAERWLNEAQAGHATYTARMGGSQIAEAMEALVQYAEKVQAEIGDPRSFLPARDALQAGWRLLIDRALPYTPDTPEGADYREKRRAFLDLCSRARDAIRDALDADGIGFTAAYAKPEPDPANSLLTGTSGGRSLADLLIEVVEELDGRATDQFFKALQQQAATVSVAVKSHAPQLASDLNAIQEAIPALQKATRTYMTPRRQAVERGRALAESMSAPKPLPR